MRGGSFCTPTPRQEDGRQEDGRPPDRPRPHWTLLQFDTDPALLFRLLLQPKTKGGWGRCHDDNNGGGVTMIEGDVIVGKGDASGCPSLFFFFGDHDFSRFVSIILGIRKVG